jgi:membrane protein YqaA with SNARE-associated domain
MDASSWFGPEQIYVASFVVSFVSGFLPLINTEAYLLSVAALSSAPALPVIALATLGQMAAKFLLYLGGRGLLRLPQSRRYETLDKLRERLERRRGSRNLLIFLSALVGFPPFYPVTILAGVVKVPVVEFLAASLVGRFLRFGAFFLFPQLLRGQLQ